MILCASAIHLFGSRKNFNLKMFKSLGLLKPKLIKLLIDLANRPGTLWTSAVLNWWLVLVGKEPAAFTVSLAKSGGARMEATEVMEAASLSRVGLQYTCSGLCLVCVIKKTLSFFVSSQLIGLLNHWLRFFRSTREKMGSQGAARIVMAGMAAQHMFT